MSKYQLIVRGERGRHVRGDCAVINLKAESLEGAQEEARLNMVGDRSMWLAKMQKDHSGKLVMNVWLHPDDALYDRMELPCGVIFDHQDEVVFEAWIVQVATLVPLDSLKKEIANWKDEQKELLEQDPEYQEYLRLKNRFGR